MAFSIVASPNAGRVGRSVPVSRPVWAAVAGFHSGSGRIRMQLRTLPYSATRCQVKIYPVNQSGLKVYVEPPSRAMVRGLIGMASKQHGPNHPERSVLGPKRSVFGLSGPSSDRQSPPVPLLSWPARFFPPFSQNWEKGPGDEGWWRF